jgi:hypothetical protein
MLSKLERKKKNDLNVKSTVKLLKGKFISTLSPETLMKMTKNLLTLFHEAV